MVLTWHTVQSSHHGRARSDGVWLSSRGFSSFTVTFARLGPCLGHTCLIKTHTNNFWYMQSKTVLLETPDIWTIMNYIWFAKMCKKNRFMHNWKKQWILFPIGQCQLVTKLKLEMSLEWLIKKLHSVLILHYQFIVLTPPVKSSMTFCFAAEIFSYLLSRNADEHCAGRWTEKKDPGNQAQEKKRKKTVRRQ